MQLNCILESLVNIYAVKYVGITFFGGGTLCFYRHAGPRTDPAALGDVPWKFGPCGWLMSMGSSPKTMITYDMRNDAR